MRMKRCPECGGYTLKDTCVKCNVASGKVGPARYSPEDPYGRYRRLMKEAMEDG
jgi:H/ACA ribonucleoprotein complex subunit 3